MKTRMLTRYEFPAINAHGTCHIWANKVRDAHPGTPETATRTLWVGARPRCYEPECKECPK